MPIIIIRGEHVVSAPAYQGPVSDHFDGKRFFNHDPIQHSSGQFIKWILTRRPGPWRQRSEIGPAPSPPQRVSAGRLRVTFINHATTLIQMDELNILTDPTWSEDCSPLPWFGFGPRRRCPPGLGIEELPPLDAVIVSHDHYDHMNVDTLKRLVTKRGPRLFVGLGNGGFLTAQGVAGCTEMDWWQSVSLSKDVRLTSVPARHFSGRGLFDRCRTLWSGFVIEGPAGVVYFAGDTGLGSHFQQIRRRFGPPRLALLPIGAFQPRWFMGPVHLSPEEAVEAHRILGAGTSMAIHFGTFPLGDDGQDEPVERLNRAVEAAGHGRGDFWVLGHGECREVPPVAAKRTGP
ncbi:MAG: MBL fold metallo-hydrolase [Phycisphaerales bacterium]|nr:MAG: MBL fold metallo-hydrolase [Phycisphaerales bacterium]